MHITCQAHFILPDLITLLSSCDEHSYIFQISNGQFKDFYSILNKYSP